MGLSQKIFIVCRGCLPIFDLSERSTNIEVVKSVRYGEARNVYVQALFGVQLRGVKGRNYVGKDVGICTNINTKQNKRMLPSQRRSRYVSYTVARGPSRVHDGQKIFPLFNRGPSFSA